MGVAARGDSGVAGEGRVASIPKFLSWGKCTMSITNINSDWMSNASSGLCARAYPPGWPPGPKTLQTFTYIYTLAQIRPLHCTISSLALRRSAINSFDSHVADQV